MKKQISILLASAMCLTLCSACSGSDTSSSESTAAEKKGTILYASGEADFDEVAYTLQELVDSSDIIAKVRVSATDSYVYPSTEAICTQITPEIQALYKGDYGNETLELWGGYMNYAEYRSAPIFEEEGWEPFDTSAYTQEELETTQVYWGWCNNYVPQEGDTILYFGKKSDNNSYTLTNSYQGLFLLQDGMWTNQALIVDDDGWQEPLVTNLLTCAGAAVTDCPNATAQTVDNVTYEYPKSQYETMVSVPEDTLISEVESGIA